jgi:hypothetical protein
MFGFILGAAAGAAGMWAYQKWFGEPDDDDWDTGVWDQPSTSSYSSTPSTADTTASTPSTSTSTAGPTSTSTGGTSSSAS